MENFGADNIAARKKRSKYARRPNTNPRPLSNYISSSSSLLNNYGGYRDINEICTNDNSRLGSERDDFSPDNEEHGLNDLGVKSNRLENESKLKKVKLKVGGVTHTIQTKSVSEMVHTNSPSAEDFQGKNSSTAKILSMRKKMGGEIPGGGLQIRKSRRVPKKRTLDEEEDDEIRYLGKLRASKVSSSYRDDQGIRENPDFIHARIYGASLLNQGGNKKSLVREDKDYVGEEEEDLMSDDELEDKMSKEHLDSLPPAGNELTITTRKRALTNGRGASPASAPNLFFPNGLPDAPSKNKKILPEVDILLRKAEAAQRRRLQAEKAAKEAEAEAIRKILGQDSTRKKREDKIKRQQEELAQEKNEKAIILGPNTVRWVMGPSGTVVTFSDDIGLPNIFSSLSDKCYPPAREKCVGPNCNKEYKYRDSKLKLPLCSLHCYKSVVG